MYCTVRWSRCSNGHILRESAQLTEDVEDDLPEDRYVIDKSAQLECE